MFSGSRRCGGPLEFITWPVTSLCPTVGILQVEQPEVAQVGDGVASPNSLLQTCRPILTITKEVTVDEPASEVSKMVWIPMVDPKIVKQLRALHALGWGSKRIAKELGIARNSVRRRYLRQGDAAETQTRPKARTLDDVQRAVAAKLLDGPAQGNAVVVKRLLAPRPARERRYGGPAGADGSRHRGSHYSTVGLDEKRATIRGVLRVVPPRTRFPTWGASGGVSEVALRIAG
jgi:hypothetical protein